jgi:hypothetical protein
MKHTRKLLKTSELIKLFKGHQAKCINCGEWFPLTPELENLIEEGIIHPLDVNLCDDCSEEASNQAIFEAELDYLIYNL